MAGLHGLAGAALSRALLVLVAGMMLSSGCGAAQPEADAGVLAEAAWAAAPESVEPLDEAALAAVLDDAGLPGPRLVELPGAPAPAFVMEVDGAEGPQAWATLRRLVGETGRYPVIVGAPAGPDPGLDYDELAVTLENAEFLAEAGANPAGVLGDADAIDAEIWFEERREAMGIASSELEVAAELPDYPWPTDRLTAHRDILTFEPLDTVLILLVPTARSWEAPAYLLWGAWNDVPGPEEHVALFRHWAETHGAEVVAMTSAVVEMVVADPPADVDAAVDLAGEHYAYAPDLVWQGTGDVDLLAAALLDAEIWYFWWD